MGWGLAWYPERQPAALVLKDPAAIGANALTRLLHEWERFQSDILVGHVRGDGGRNTGADTQPFVRSFGARDWVFAHAGDLAPAKVAKLPLGDSPSYEPVGRTDSERVFCALLDAGAGAPRAAARRPGLGAAARVAGRHQQLRHRHPAAERRPRRRWRTRTGSATPGSTGRGCRPRSPSAR